MIDDSAAGALDRAVASASWDAVMHAMNQDWAELLADHPEGLLAALEALPDEVLRANPRWSMARTYVSRITRGDAADATRYRHAALPDRPDTLMDSLAELTSRAAGHRAAGRFSEARDLALRARDILDDVVDEALGEVQPALPEFHYQWAMALDFAGDFAGAIREYTDAYDHAVVGRHPLVQLNAAGGVAWIHALAGRNALAADWLGRLPQAHDDTWWESRYSVPARLAQAYLLIDELRFDDARVLLAERMEAGQHPEYWAARALLQSMVVRETADAASLLVTLDAQTAGSPAELTSAGMSGAMLALARSALLARSGYLPDALRVLAETSVVPQSLAGQLLLSAQACLELLAGRYTAASRIADRLRSAATDSPRIVTTALVVSAMSELRLDDLPRALDDFRSAAGVATTHEVYSAFVMISRGDLRDLFDADPGVLSSEMRERMLSRGRVSVAGDALARLTPREAAVVAAVLSTESVADAAAALFVSPNTVKSQLRSIYAKLGINNRQQLAALTRRPGLRR